MTSVYVRPRLDAFLLRHTLLDPYIVQVCNVHPHSTTDPLDRPVVGLDVSLEVGHTMVVLFVPTPNHRAVKCTLVDVFRPTDPLEVAGRVGTPVRVRPPGDTGRGGARLRSGRRSVGGGGRTLVTRGGEPLRREDLC